MLTGKETMAKVYNLPLHSQIVLEGEQMRLWIENNHHGDVVLQGPSGAEIHVLLQGESAGSISSSSGLSSSGVAYIQAMNALKGHVKIQGGAAVIKHAGADLNVDANVRQLQLTAKDMNIEALLKRVNAGEITVEIPDADKIVDQDLVIPSNTVLTLVVNSLNNKKASILGNIQVMARKDILNRGGKIKGDIVRLIAGGMIDIREGGDIHGYKDEHLEAEHILRDKIAITPDQPEYRLKPSSLGQSFMEWEKIEPFKKTEHESRVISNRHNVTWIVRKGDIDLKNAGIEITGNLTLHAPAGIVDLGYETYQIQGDHDRITKFAQFVAKAGGFVDINARKLIMPAAHIESGTGTRLESEETIEAESAAAKYIADRWSRSCGFLGLGHESGTKEEISYALTTLISGGEIQVVSKKGTIKNSGLATMAGGDITFQTRDNFTLNALKVTAHTYESSQHPFSSSNDHSSQQEVFVFSALGKGKLNLISTQGKLETEGAYVQANGGRFSGSKGIDIKPVTIESHWESYQTGISFRILGAKIGGIPDKSKKGPDIGTQILRSQPVVGNIKRLSDTLDNPAEHGGITGAISDAVGLGISCLNTAANICSGLLKGKLGSALFDLTKITQVGIGIEQQTTEGRSITDQLGMIKGDGEFIFETDNDAPVTLSTNADMAVVRFGTTNIIFKGGRSEMSQATSHQEVTVSFDLAQGGAPSSVDMSASSSSYYAKRSVHATMNMGKIIFEKDANVYVVGASVTAGSVEGNAKVKEEDVQDEVRTSSRHMSISVGLNPSGSINSIGGNVGFDNSTERTTTHSSGLTVQSGDSSNITRETAVRHQDYKHRIGISAAYTHSMSGAKGGPIRIPVHLSGNIGGASFRADIPAFWDTEALKTTVQTVRNVLEFSDNQLPSHLHQFKNTEKAKEADEFKYHPDDQEDGLISSALDSEAIGDIESDQINSSIPSTPEDSEVLDIWREAIGHDSFASDMGQSGDIDVLLEGNPDFSQTIASPDAIGELDKFIADGYDKTEEFLSNTYKKLAAENPKLFKTMENVTKYSLQGLFFASLLTPQGRAAFVVGEMVRRSGITEWGKERMTVTLKEMGFDRSAAILSGTMVGFVESSITKRAANVGTFGTRVNRIKGSTAAERVKLNPWKIRDYAQHIDTVTVRKLQHSQISHLKEALRTTKFEKLDEVAQRTHRKEFNAVRPSLIQEWEVKTGQKWPNYQVEVISRGEKVLEKRKYDAHHIIQSNHAGPNEWWNIHPALPAQHSRIHGSSAPARQIFNGPKKGTE